MKKKRASVTRVKEVERFLVHDVMEKGIEPKPKYEPTVIKNWEEIIDKHRPRLEGKSWIFRGQTDADWSLETTLKRHCKYFRKDLLKSTKNDISKATNAEEVLCREFRRRYHQYSQNIPKDDDYLEWFSIMQHYGAPTRLLDFTYSMSIALFFALEYAYTLFESKKYPKCAVWAINADWAQDKSRTIFGTRQGYEFLNKLLTEETAMKFKNVFMRKKPISFVCPVNPFRLTERLTIQKGIFLCPGDVNKLFETNLNSMKGYKENIIKFEIPINKDSWPYAMDWLYNQNIYRASLFPDLEGFAKSLQASPPKPLVKFK